MSNWCKSGDTGTGSCPSHDSTVVFNTVFNNGATTVYGESSSLIRIGDVGISTCGHPTVALTGASRTTAEGELAHRVGDTGIGSGGGNYTSLTGASTIVVE